MDIPIPSIKPIYHPSPTTPTPKSKPVHTALQTLHLQPHPEGGYYAETDRHPLRIPNPYSQDQSDTNTNTNTNPNTDTRSLSSTIYYHLTPDSPTSFFHLNRSRTIHSLHRGRARYVIIHADLATHDGPAPVTSFVVGPDLDKGERMQWVVEGGKYKASYLLPDLPSENGDGESEGLLITETVVPGFEFEDHEYLSRQTMERLLPEEQYRALSWMLKKD
ncbi:cupin domain protein [Aspergillus udagawae]|nr:cupin domain protein [Aspergillus udagawae]